MSDEKKEISIQPPAGQLATDADQTTIEVMLRRSELLQDAMKRLLDNKKDYGLIPGIAKPTLLQPGAEKLAQLFQLRPEYKHQTTYLENGHITIIVSCTLIHIISGMVRSEASAMCSTMEKKYRWRNAQRKCPNCAKPFIFKSREEGKGFYCWNKPEKNMLGCGWTFAEDDTAITSQEVGQVENTDIADQYNTVLKICEKRAFISAVKMGCAASGIFTVDVEDMEEGTDNGKPKPAGNRNPPPRNSTSTPTSSPGPVCPKCHGKDTITSRFDSTKWYCKTVQPDDSVCKNAWPKTLPAGTPQKPGDAPPFEDDAPRLEDY